MVYNDDYIRKVIPFLKETYFHDTLERILFTHIKDHLEKYNNNPTIDILIGTNWSSSFFKSIISMM